MNFWETNNIIQNIKHPLAIQNNIQWDIQREDLNHPFISGNKFRKLKYNIEYCLENNIKNIITFGGAHSNHVAAFAYACKLFNLNGVAFINGNYINYISPTLDFAKNMGVEINYLSSSNYKTHNIPKKYKDYFIIPEGADNEFGLLGTKEIINSNNSYDYIFCPVGTGNTLKGIILSSNNHQKIIGVCTLKGAENLNIKIETSLKEYNYNFKNWNILHEYHLGGYAKFDSEIVRIYNFFKSNFNIELDPIYTCKMIYAIESLINKKEIKNCKILCIHTGGLQGVEAFKNRHQKKWAKI